MAEKKAFTLVELLVVISIIALLLAILMPSLGRARDIAKATVCKTRLRGMGQVFMMYLNHNDGKFCYNMPTTSSVSWPVHNKSIWVEVLRPFYGEDPDMRLCPVATKHQVDRDLVTPGPGANIPSKFTAWGYNYQSVLGQYGYASPDKGSYSLNAWQYNPTQYTVNAYGDDMYWLDVPSSSFWKGVAIGDSSKIPVFTDGFYRGSSVTSAIKAAPPSEEDLTPEEVTSEPESNTLGTTVCINRHKGSINGVFLDGSARKIDLKEIWKLKWHKTFNTNDIWTLSGGVTKQAWPEWIRPYKDY